MNNKKIALIGLGYVGLPLAIEFGKKRVVVGFDIE
jgi:UDP-N-acetyl-D-galactosamine dehydrogenase